MYMLIQLNLSAFFAVSINFYWMILKLNVNNNNNNKVCYHEMLSTKRPASHVVT